MSDPHIDQGRTLPEAEDTMILSQETVNILKKIQRAEGYDDMNQTVSELTANWIQNNDTFSGPSEKELSEARDELRHRVLGDNPRNPRDSERL